jgi:probable selenium-dependent hydroxylase accessory protein YqeC
MNPDEEPTDHRRAKPVNLASALRAEGVVSVVGAGGKKTTMYALAERIERAVVTATVRIPIFDEHVETIRVTEDPIAAIETTENWPVGVVPEREREDRYLGYDPAVIDELAAEADVDAILVKADGARMRRFKAPDDREPQLPRHADTVVPVASARVVGKPLTDEFVHRVDRVAALTGLEPGDEIRPVDVATVLADGRGGLKDVPADATVVPLLNMVDDDRLESIARDVATKLLERVVETDPEVDVPHVVLARMVDDDPVRAVVR